MRVFISYSGDTGKKVAEALARWLPRVVQPCSPWVSTLSISAGYRWRAALDEALMAAFGVVVITRDSVNAVWPLFEAGALAKLPDSRLVPYLVHGGASVAAPLAPFHSCVADREGTRSLVEALFSAAGWQPQHPLRQELFERHWPELEAELVLLSDPQVWSKATDWCALAPNIDQNREQQLTQCMNEMTRAAAAMLANSRVRANLFTLDLSQIRRGIFCLRMHSNVSRDIDGPRGDLTFSPGEGLTGCAFTQALPFAAWGPPGGADWRLWDFDLGAAECTQEALEIGGVKRARINNDLRWILSTPIRSRPSGGLVSAVLNLDGFHEFPTEHEAAKKLFADLRVRVSPFIEKFSGILAGAPAQRLSFRVEP